MSPRANPSWSPHFWLGLDLRGWYKLLRVNRFRVEWPYWWIALADTVGITFNTVLRPLESLVYRQRLKHIRISPAPVFVLGHWRSGTTLMHEMLHADPRHACPTTYECFCPHHFLLTESWLTRLTPFIVPKQRPSDEMRMGWQRPQEDEFALANLGVQSPYWKIAFPNHPDPCRPYLTLRDLDEASRESWRQAWVGFLKKVAAKNPGSRLILKSPTHTARLRFLLQCYPDARFVHMVRDPEALYSSTLSLWQGLYRAHGYQRPRGDNDREYVLETLCRMYTCFEEDRQAVPASQLVDVRYEDLVQDPLATMAAVYERLGLGPFNRVQSHVDRYFRERSGYRASRHQLSAEDQQLVRRRWERYGVKYGYFAKRSDDTVADA